MRKLIVCALLLLYPLTQSLASNQQAQPESTPGPWFTGPLLAGGGTVVPAGHTNYELMLTYMDNYGHFNKAGKVISATNTHAFSQDLMISQGVASKLELNLNLPYTFNSKLNAHNNGFGDIDAGLGYQLAKQSPKSWMPDVKIGFTETFPTGTYNKLNPLKLGTDATGTGAYQTNLYIHAQKSWTLQNHRYLRARFTFSDTLPTHTDLKGINAFGGTAETNGRLDLGNHTATDLAFEFSINQHWVPAIDFLYTTGSASHFKPNDPAQTGPATEVGVSKNEQFSIAPALEYNVSSKLGIIGGAWFTVAGTKSTTFSGAMLALNYYD